MQQGGYYKLVYLDGSEYNFRVLEILSEHGDIRVLTNMNIELRLADILSKRWGELVELTREAAGF